MSKKWLWGWVLVWFGLSCYGLFWRVPDIDGRHITHLDKVAHFSMFFGQSYLLGCLIDVRTKKTAMLLWCVSLSWAVASEIIQGQLVMRTMDFWDGVADMLGATLAIVWVGFIRHAIKHP